MKCKGCGIELNFIDPQKIGYSSKEKNNLCLRCFSLKNYGKVIEESHTYKFKLKNQPLYYVIDILSLPFFYLDNKFDRIDAKNINIVINKIDLLNRDINLNKILVWFILQLEIKKINYNKIFFVSAFRNLGMNELVESVRKNKFSNFVGMENSGKSSILNLAFNFNSISSNLLGTTREIISKKIGDTLIGDYPGFKNQNTIQKNLNYEELKKINYSKEIRPKTYQLNSEQSLFIDGLAIISFPNQSGKQNVTVFTYNSLNIHRTNIKNLSKIKMNKKLFKFNYEIIQFRKSEIALSDYKYKKIDLYISGLLFITIPNLNQKIIIETFNDVDIKIVPSFFI